jgi:hypothetical protein
MMAMLSKTHRLLLEKHLSRAGTHVALGEKAVVDQTRLVGELARDGHATEEAEKLLGSFQQLQNLHVAHFRRLVVELANADRAEVWDPPPRFVGASKIARDVSEQKRSSKSSPWLGRPSIEVKI